MGVRAGVAAPALTSLPPLAGPFLPPRRRSTPSPFISSAAWAARPRPRAGRLAAHGWFPKDALVLGWKLPCRQWLREGREILARLDLLVEDSVEEAVRVWDEEPLLLRVPRLRQGAPHGLLHLLVEGGRLESRRNIGDGFAQHPLLGLLPHLEDLHVLGRHVPAKLLGAVRKTTKLAPHAVALTPELAHQVLVARPGGRVSGLIRGVPLSGHEEVNIMGE
eukprot:UN2024